MSIELYQNGKHVEIRIMLMENLLVPEARRLRAELDAVIKQAEKLQRPPLRKLGEF